MNMLERYEVMLDQAVKELGRIEIPEDRKKALELQGDLAPRLGDVLFRLSVEHAVAFAPFKETVVGILAGQRPALVTSGRGSSPRPFAAHLEQVHPIILLALEMMPSEAFDH